MYFSRVLKDYFINSMATHVVYTTERPLYKLTQFIWFLFYIVEVILLFRFVLQLIGANPSAAFTQFVYSLSHPFVAPFLSIVRSFQVETGVIEWSTLIALFVYWVVAYVIVRLILIGRPVTHGEAHEGLDREEYYN
jgi:uncharacterized protein YggT (Ycf19 family)